MIDSDFARGFNSIRDFFLISQVGIKPTKRYGEYTLYSIHKQPYSRFHKHLYENQSKYHLRDLTTV